MDWVSGVQDWKGGADPHAAHDHHAMAMSDHAAHAAPAVPLARIVERARAEHMPAPAIVQPPGAPNLFGPPNRATWKQPEEDRVGKNCGNKGTTRGGTYK